MSQHEIDAIPTFDEVVEALVDLVYEDCSGTIGPDTSSRMGMFATTTPAIKAVRVLERLNRVVNVREIGGKLRADWSAKSEPIGAQNQMDDESVKGLEGTGWTGFAVWNCGKDRWNAALISPRSFEPFAGTVLWSYANTPSEAIRQIVEKAQKVHPDDYT